MPLLYYKNGRNTSIVLHLTKGGLLLREISKIGFVGLGNMGMGMALNLVKAGYEVHGLDLVPEKTAHFQAHGGIAAETNCQVGQAADLVFVMVLNGKQAEAVLFGENGLSQGMGPGSIVVLTASVGQGASAALGKKLEGLGIHFVDAAVSGGQPAADAGTLTIMEAGPDQVLDACEPVLRVVGKKIIRCGCRPGDAQVIKSCLQAVTAAEFSVVAEMMVLAAKAGADPKVLGEVINSSAPGSAATRMATEHIVRREFQGGGSQIITLHKDMGILLDLAREQTVPVPISAIAAMYLQAGQAKLPGEDDWAITKLLEEIVGVQVQ